MPYFFQGNPTIFIESNIHAREWVTSATSTFILNEFLTSQDEDVRDLAENIDWVFVPVFNVDGFEYTHTTVNSIFIFIKFYRQIDFESFLCIYLLKRIAYGERIARIMDFVLVLTRIGILIFITQVFFVFHSYLIFYSRENISYLLRKCWIFLL